MAASQWYLYDSFKERMADGGHDLDGDVFKVILCASTSNALTMTLDAYAEITNELSTANGYTAGGDTPGSVTWTEATGTITFDSADPSWTAAAGSITARMAVLYNETSTTDLLVAVCLLDDTPANVTVTDGNTLTIQLHTNGYFQLSGGRYT